MFNHSNGEFTYKLLTIPIKIRELCSVNEIVSKFQEQKFQQTLSLRTKIDQNSQ